MCEGAHFFFSAEDAQGSFALPNRMGEAYSEPAGLLLNVQDGILSKNG
jgi:hypothetical protein